MNFNRRLTNKLDLPEFTVQILDKKDLNLFIKLCKMILANNQTNIDNQSLKDFCQTRKTKEAIYFNRRDWGKGIEYNFIKDNGPLIYGELLSLKNDWDKITKNVGLKDLELAEIVKQIRKEIQIQQ